MPKLMRLKRRELLGLLVVFGGGAILLKFGMEGLHQKDWVFAAFASGLGVVLIVASLVQSWISYMGTQLFSKEYRVPSSALRETCIELGSFENGGLVISIYFHNDWRRYIGVISTTVAGIVRQKKLFGGSLYPRGFMVGPVRLKISSSDGANIALTFNLEYQGGKNDDEQLLIIISRPVGIF